MDTEDDEDDQPAHKKRKTNKRKSRKKKTKDDDKPDQVKHALGFFECPCWRILRHVGIRSFWVSYERPAYDHTGPLPKDYPKKSNNDNVKLDSWLEAYRRDVGFKEQDQDEADDVENIPSISASYARARKGTKQKKSKDQEISAWHRFESYCWMMHPTHDYTVWLCKVKAKSEDLEFMPSPVSLVMGYMDYCRGNGAAEKWNANLTENEGSQHPGWTFLTEKDNDGNDVPQKDRFGREIYGRNQAYLSVNKIPGLMWSVQKTFNFEFNRKHPRIEEKLFEYKELDTSPSSAKVFNMVEDLKLLRNSCFAMKSWGDKMKVRAWAMFLFSICFMCRASCLTTYCPKVEHIEFPDHPNAYGSDGLPEYLVIVWYDWKSRSSTTRNTPYKLQMYRNHVDGDFCPVFWLLYYLALFDISSGPIFQGDHGEFLTPPFWYRTVNAIFDQVSRLQNCTSHSVRRSAATWAGRCKAQVPAVRNCGRWVSTETMFKYMEDGKTQYNRNSQYGTVDPQQFIWVFKDPTVGDRTSPDSPL